ncbi:MAG: inositol monophosphatase family protein [Candidatus Binatia bacterium]
MKAFLAVAEEAAEAAGSLIRQNLQKTKEIHYKSAIDLVTSVDREAEERIVQILHDYYPDHSILAEEGTGAAAAGSDHRWIIDPLDGTTNFTHAYPSVGVSIALEKKGEIILGLVYDPVREENFQAVKAAGAFLNGEPVQVSKVADLDKSLLGTGFPYDRRERVDFYLSFWKSFMLRCQGIRRTGSAALDLCYLACGRLDGFWEFKLHPWDTAAGSLIIREAGGKLSDFSGDKFSIYGKETLASNGLIHEEMLGVMANISRT